ncbi:MAG TPA: hypothetical protein VFS59_16080 [Gemmatimonadaceae bacterium]|nr:hypothetical protein [Gemmatimonadaceae bacterium]
MPDQNVDVTFGFDPDGNTRFTFDPPEVPMRDKGRVIFHRRPANASWTFVVGIVKNDSAEQFSSALRGDGKKLHIHDEHTELGRYEYMIIVKLGGQYFPSPDPVIVNEPGMEAE